MFPSNDGLIRTLAQEHQNTVREILTRHEKAPVFSASRPGRLRRRLRAWLFGHGVAAKQLHESPAFSEAERVVLAATRRQGVPGAWRGGAESGDGAHS